VVYFIQRGLDGPIKIGHSVDPQQRLRTFQTGSADGLRILGFAPGGSELEAELRRRLKPHRHRGEWFKPVLEVFALIRELGTPEFRVVGLKAYAVLRRDREADPTRACPFCGRRHTHGLGDGHLAAHCSGDAKDSVRSGAVTLYRRDGYLLVTDSDEGTPNEEL
jgi:hypothetical protein